ncbi:hypothetical protein BDB01DRAFT_796072 [Pilobolus umbonatus]|nr:hypothetical protein BDB01DRAFT_796072 [Pilobolus umbonatus]
MSDIDHPHLQLCVNDLLHPTEKSESLLEALTATQLEEIEKTLHKIKEKKQSPKQPMATSISHTITNRLPHDWAYVATQIAKVLVDTITHQSHSPLATKPPVSGSSSGKPTTLDPKDNNEPTAGSVVSNHEPCTEIRDGVEWVSFVYSHHRNLKRYSIRTDIDKVDINLLGDKFKIENCVYPRANLPREQYKGNRWAYETECNTLGWKLAYLNSDEIVGKRGLIQRAVDSYRNRYPSMRSRRVARQEKLAKGTLRKRKNRESEEPECEEKKRKEDDEQIPKTVSIDDGLGGTKCRIRTNVESVSLDSIDLEFRRANCVYPRAMEINTLSPFASQRQLEEAKCNELAWKLAWLNPKQLANRKGLLQRVLDVYRSKFLPELNPRKNSLRMTGPTGLSIDNETSDVQPILSVPLTVAALAAQEKELDNKTTLMTSDHEDSESLYSGTTDSLDFRDCFSPHSISSPSSVEKCHSPSSDIQGYGSSTLFVNDLMLSVPSSTNDLLLGPTTTSPRMSSCRHSISSSSSGSGLSSPTNQDHMDYNDSLFKDNTMLELYTEPIQFPAAGVHFDHNDYIKTEEDHLMTDTLISQLFHI